MSIQLTFDQPESDQFATLHQQLTHERRLLADNPYRQSLFLCGCKEHQPCDASILAKVARHGGHVCPNVADAPECPDDLIPY